MATWKPDPTFYPSARMAMQAAPEKLAYVALLNVEQTPRPDALAVVDVDPESSSYARILGRVDMPKPGDELHHFGWNACSSALCPYAPHPHIERRYLIVPGLRSSRIHVIDTKPDPRKPSIVKVIEPDELAMRTGYSRPHTLHCGPEGIYVSALGAPNGDGPGGIFMMDHESFDVLGRWEVERGPQYLAYDLLVASRLRHADHQRVGHAEDDRKRHRARAAARRKIRPQAAFLGSAPPATCAGARSRRRATDGAGATPGARPEQGLWLRRRRREPEGSLGIDLAVAPRPRQMGHPQGDRDPRRAGRGQSAAAAAARLQGRAAARLRHRPHARRPLPLRVVLGHRRDAPV